MTDLSCTYCARRGHSEDDCTKKRIDQRGETFVSPHPYTDCTDLHLFDREPHCSAHCGFVRADPIHDVTNDAVAA